MFYVISLLLLALLNLSFPDYVRERCRCPKEAPPSTAFDKATTVFTGKVTEIVRRADTQVVWFEIDWLWKGIIEIEKGVNTPTHDCGWDFQLGSSYLVYAYEHEGQLLTDICTRTVEVTGHRSLRFMSDDYMVASEYRGKCNYGNLFDPSLLCSRQLYQICDCDGKTYGNVCDAEKHGVFTHQGGPCSRYW